MSLTYLYYCSNEQLTPETKFSYGDVINLKKTIKWGTYNSDPDDLYIPKNNEILTKEIITKIINSKCNSPITQADRLNFLQRNEGNYICLILNCKNNYYFCKEHYTAPQQSG